MVVFLSAETSLYVRLVSRNRARPAPGPRNRPPQPKSAKRVQGPPVDSKVGQNRPHSPAEGPGRSVLGVPSEILLGSRDDIGPTS